MPPRRVKKSGAPRLQYSARACAGKIGYATAGEAREVMRGVTKVKGLFTYRCQECGAWHYGHGVALGKPSPKTFKNWNWRKASTDD